MIEIVRDLQQRLADAADDDTRRWWERYLRREAVFRGVAMAEIRRAVHAWCRTHRLDRMLTADERFSLADRLIREPYSEDKLAGVLFVEELLVPAGEIGPKDLDRMALWFDEGHLADWNVTDWTSVKALSALARRDGRATIRTILAWHDAPNLWRARASIVSFANTADRAGLLYDGFVDDLLEACSTVIRRPERFAKTGVGWVLRSLSASEPDRVVAFVEAHLDRFSTEAVRSALKRVPDHRSGALLARHRA